MYRSSDVDHLERSDGALRSFVSYGTARASTSLLDVFDSDESEDDGCLATEVELGSPLGDAVADEVVVRSLATYDAADDDDSIVGLGRLTE